MADTLPASANMLRSPVQAAKTFAQSGGFPRQRNAFIIRFWLHGLAAQSNLTFAIKSIDRPKFNTKTEKLNQYNKKRVVFTGFEIEPIRLQFFDSADGAAQNMWTQYSQYYFGDMKNTSQTPGQTNSSYAYDIITPNFIDNANSGFGFTAKNGGSQTSGDQYFFDRVDIFHFYDGVYDLYQLTHPRISSYDPDDLDYESSSIAMISMTLLYENIQYFQQQAVTGASFEEFQNRFNGNPLQVPGELSPSPTSHMSNSSPSNPSVSSLLTNPSSTTNPFDFRFNNNPVGGALGLFGNFSFGPSSTGNTTSLSTMSLGNPGLAGALGLGTSNSLANASLFGSTPSINSQTYDVISARANSVSSGFGTATDSITGSMLAANAINGSSGTVNASRQIVLSPEAYGAYNANQTGTSQIGFNEPPASNDPPIPINPGPDSSGIVIDAGTA
jgi:hypothetical protein